MTDEEIEELAEDICNDLDTTVYNSEGGLIDVYDNMEIACRAGIKAGAKRMQEKLKCCGNCKYGSSHGVCISSERCVDMNKWEIKE